MRFLFYILCLMILLLILPASRAAAQQPAEWQATITATNDPESISRQLTFGADPGASDGFDVAYDVVLPPPPPEQPPIALDAALIIIGPLPRLSRDIRLKADANQWQLSVRSDTAPISLTWNISGVPSGKCVFLINGESTIDMRAQSSLVLIQGQHFLTLEAFIPAIGNTPPVADAGGIYEGEPGVEVIFDGSGSFDVDGDPLIYSWAFGDGSIGSGVAPAHIYSSSGTYEVSLVVNDLEVNSSPSITTAYIYYQGEVQQAIVDLDPGWTLFSIWVQPIDTRIEVILASILDEMDSIWTYDPVAQEWLRYAVDGSPFMNNLTNITCGVGYWVKMSQAGTLIVQGTAPPTSIELLAGVNLVGCNSDVPRLITDCIYSIECNAVWAYDSEQAAWERYFPDGPVFMNSLEYMEPGKGYVIEAESAGELTYP